MGSILPPKVQPILWYGWEGAARCAALAVLAPRQPLFDNIAGCGFRRWGKAPVVLIYYARR